MNRINALLLGVGLIAAVAVVPASAATDNLTINLAEQNGSGESGTATLTQAGANVKVVLTIANAPAAAQPAHIHDGNCASLGGVKYPLTSAVNGSSTTTVNNVTIDQLLAGKYAINVHKSADDLGDYVACGNIAMPANAMQ